VTCGDGNYIDANNSSVISGTGQTCSIADTALAQNLQNTKGRIVGYKSQIVPSAVDGDTTYEIQYGDHHLFLDWPPPPGGSRLLLIPTTLFPVGYTVEIRRKFTTGSITITTFVGNVYLTDFNSAPAIPDPGFPLEYNFSYIKLVCDRYVDMSGTYNNWIIWDIKLA
jgi:hypothetical protein